MWKFTGLLLLVIPCLVKMTIADDSSCDLFADGESTTLLSDTAQSTTSVQPDQSKMTSMIATTTTSALIQTTKQTTNPAEALTQPTTALPEGKTTNFAPTNAPTVPVVTTITSQVTDAPIGGDQTLITPGQWSNLFPERWGVGPHWTQTYSPLPIYYPAMAVDYYSQANLMKAIELLKPIQLRITAQNSAISVYRKNKRTLENDWQLLFQYGWGTVNKTVDFSLFANEAGATKQDQLRELAAFLATVAYATKEDLYGLFYREEAFYEQSYLWGQPMFYYADTSEAAFPPSTKPTYYPKGSPKAGQQRFPTTSYHGRGPAMLTGNVLYGQASGALFGNVSLLLENPDKVLEDGVVGFMTALWHWMVPQSSKPSCHEAMYRHISPQLPWGFGRAIMAVSGNSEFNSIYGGKSYKDDYVTRRINFYKAAAKQLNVNVGVDGEQLDTQNMYAW